MSNQVISTIEARHCKRSFLKKEIPVDIIKNVLISAGNAPSSKNTQPWQVSVVSGATLKSLSEAMLAKFDHSQYEKPDYQYTTDPISDTFRNRARACGFALFDLKGIDRTSKEQRREHDRQNFLFFGAPVEIIFFLPKNSERGNFLDMGFFMQNVMLGLLANGISSCPQFSIAEYPHIIRSVLKKPDDLWVVSGLACGYADDSKINTFIPKRLELEEYASFFN